MKVTDRYEDALATEKFDAVFILTPTAMHLDMATEALNAGCHVFIEKPLASTKKGVAELKALAAEKDRKVMVGFCFRYHEVLRAIVADQEIVCTVDEALKSLDVVTQIYQIPAKYLK